MPKEITHWLIAKRVADGLHDSPLGNSAAAFPNCLLLGAVLHDALFYVRNKRWKHTVLALADELHGAGGEDTLAVIGYGVEAITRSQRSEPVRAFIIGMLTHIVTDSCFHPLVYYLTGNYYDEDPHKRTRAVQLHRGFETTLDVYLCGTFRNAQTFSLQRYIRQAGVPAYPLIAESLAPLAAAKGLPELGRMLRSAFRIFSVMQQLYRTNVLCTLLELLHPVLPVSAREIAALFYLPMLAGRAPALHGEHHFKNPVTGKEITATIGELFDTAVQESLRLCRELEPALLGIAPFNPPGPGKSLDCGIASTPISAAKYFKKG